MALLNVLKFPDPRLRLKGKRIENITPQFATLAQDMLETMYSQKGVGLAAIQVDQCINLLVADTRCELEEENEQKIKDENDFKNKLTHSADLKDEQNSRYKTVHLKKDLVVHVKQPLILFNPEIIQKKGSVVFPEGCLSFPSYFADVKRAEVVKVKALNEKGEEVFVHTDGLLSICLQHEIDHLHGRLFIDHLSSIKAKKLKEEIKKYGYPQEQKQQTK